MTRIQRCLESLDEALGSDHQYKQWLGFQVNERHLSFRRARSSWISGLQVTVWHCPEKSLWGFLPEQGLLQWRRMTGSVQGEGAPGGERERLLQRLCVGQGCSHPAAFLLKITGFSLPKAAFPK